MGHIAHFSHFNTIRQSCKKGFVEEIPAVSFLLQIWKIIRYFSGAGHPIFLFRPSDIVCVPGLSTR